MNVTQADLVYKIGLLTLENDMLRQQNAALQAQIDAEKKNDSADDTENTEKP